MNQKPRSIDEHIKHLQNRGMQFPDMNSAVEFFSRISYSRLKYYWRDMIDDETDGDFIEGASFDTVIERYLLDHDLRMILFDAIETIEVAFRAKIINHMSKAADNGLWYLDSSLFEDKQRHQDFVLDLKYEFERSTEPFAKKYIAEHSNWDSESFSGDNPDAWLIIEIATFGTLSKMYKNLKSQLPQRSAIANDFGLYSSKDFSNWIEVISLLRNIAAHHSRLWNRSFSKKVSDPKGKRDRWLNGAFTEQQKKKPYAVACAVAYLCRAINPRHKFSLSVKELASKYQNISFGKYGFPIRWESEPLWR
ncbi:Abi family protein [Lepagella muris]|jgi:abortive infection bacteriophage resistance protein|nr:Abi family protein [Lepagella muris]